MRRVQGLALGGLVLLVGGCPELNQATADSDDGEESTGSTGPVPMGTPDTGADTGETTGNGGDATGSSTSGGDTTEGVVDGDDDDDDDDSTGGTTGGGTTDGGTTDGGSTDEGTTDSGTTDSGTTDSGTTDGSTTTGVNECPAGIIAFTDAQWSYYSTPNVGLTASNGNDLTLIEDNVTDAGAAVFYVGDLEPPYTINFDYTIFDDDGAENGNVFNSADGVAVMIAKDEGPYGITAPPTGSYRGFFEDSTGYAVDFSIYQTRLMQIRSGSGAIVEGPVVPAASTYPHGQWREVSVAVETDSIVVTYEGGVELTYAAPLDLTHTRIGFGAGTGGADGQHRIRDVEIVCD